MKHAYIIICHKDKKNLQTLVHLLDDERNDIILIPDKKSSDSLISGIHTSFSQLIIPNKKKWVDIRWGTISLVKAEILGFKTALNHGNYSYIHLLSGADLPLKPQNYIHRYFNSLPKGTNLINVGERHEDYENLRYYTNYFHFFVKYFRCSNVLIRYFFSFLRKVTLEFQKTIGLKRDWNDIVLKKGSNWVSITQKFANYLICNEKYILKKFRYILCPDEIYKQSLFASSEFANSNLVDEKEIGNKRKIDWNRGNPHIWGIYDWKELTNNDDLFARKFDSSKDDKVIEKLYKYLMLESQAY